MYRVNYTPQTLFDRNVGVRIMEQQRENLNIDGKIFSHTFATQKASGEIELHGSAACFVPDKNNAHYLAFQIETAISCIVSVETFVK